MFIPALLSCSLLLHGADNREKEVELVLQEREASISKANDAAVKKLEVLMTARTKKGDLDGALAVKAAIQKIKGGEGGAAENAAGAKNANDEAVGGLPANPAAGKMTEAAVKREIDVRYSAFTKALVSDDANAAYEFLDPKTRENVSADALKGYLKLMAGFLKLGQVPKDGARITSVKIGVRENDAKVIPALKIRGLNWEDQKPQYWVLKNGKWYIGDEKELDNFK